MDNPKGVTWHSQRGSNKPEAYKPVSSRLRGRFVHDLLTFQQVFLGSSYGAALPERLFGLGEAYRKVLKEETGSSSCYFMDVPFAQNYPSHKGLNLRIQDFFQLGQILMLPNGNQCIVSRNFCLGRRIKKHTAISPFYRKDYQVVVLPYT